MITFKEFLIEKKMGGSAYAQTLKRLEEDAKIGFEIEVFVPTDSFYHREPDRDPAKKLKLTDINSWNEFEVYFDVSKQQEGAIMGDFESWKVEQEDGWVDEHWEDYVTDEESRTAEEDARRMALKAAVNKFTWEQWFEKKFEGTQDFISAYELEPSHGWADDEHVNQHAPFSSGYHSGFKNTAKTMAEHLGRALKTTVRVNAAGYETWNLTHDTSIKDKDDVDYESGQDGYGVEIVSPPLSPAKAIEQLEIVLKMMQDYGIETNESTGIHVNISLPNMKSFDPLKLVLFMGDKHILEKFGRSTNSFTSSQLQQVIDGISLTGKIPRSANELIALGREALAETGKYFSVNLMHLPKYLEFRAAGGAGYHHRVHDIKEIIGRWLTAVELAADPEMHRREYLKKVMALLDKTPDAAAEKAVAEQSLEDWLKRKHLMLSQTIDAADTPGDKLIAMRALLIQLGSESSVLKSVPFKWMKDMRSLFSKLGVSYDSVLGITTRKDAIEAVKAVGRAFRLTK